MLPYNPKPIQEFWQQLESTLDELLNSQQSDPHEAEALLDSYRHALEKIDRNLTFHFEKEDDNGPVKMVFGCDGYPESIHSVLTLVGAAPQLTGIHFSAFNHRHDPIPSHILVADEMCELSDFWYGLNQVDSQLHLAIYMQDVPDSLEFDPRIEAVMIFLDALIGEYELMTRVATLDWLEMPVDPKDFGLQPLEELRHSFDQLKHRVGPIGIVIH